jgi:hypothetical protein
MKRLCDHEERFAEHAKEICPEQSESARLAVSFGHEEEKVASLARRLKAQEGEAVDPRSSLAAVERENARLASELAVVAGAVIVVQERQESESSQQREMGRGLQRRTQEEVSSWKGNSGNLQRRAGSSRRRSLICGKRKHNPTTRCRAKSRASGLPRHGWRRKRRHFRAAFRRPSRASGKMQLR